MSSLPYAIRADLMDIEPMSCSAKAVVGSFKSHFESQQAKDRIRTLATDYARGKPLPIVSARLKGPFGTWRNPWPRSGTHYRITKPASTHSHVLVSRSRQKQQPFNTEQLKETRSSVTKDLEPVCGLSLPRLQAKHHTQERSPESPGAGRLQHRHASQLSTENSNCPQNSLPSPSESEREDEQHGQPPPTLKTSRPDDKPGQSKTHNGEVARDNEEHKSKSSAEESGVPSELSVLTSCQELSTKHSLPKDSSLPLSTPQSKPVINETGGQEVTPLPTASTGSPSFSHEQLMRRMFPKGLERQAEQDGLCSIVHDLRKGMKYWKDKEAPASGQLSAFKYRVGVDKPSDSRAEAAKSPQQPPQSETDGELQSDLKDMTTAVVMGAQAQSPAISTQVALKQAQDAFWSELNTPIKNNVHDINGAGAVDDKELGMSASREQDTVDTQMLLDAVPWQAVSPAEEIAHPIQNSARDHGPMSTPTQTTPSSDVFKLGAVPVSPESKATEMKQGVQAAVDFLSSWDVEAEARRCARAV